MNKKEEDLIERYVYDVVHRLSSDQRDDIEKELRSLIDDMLEGEEAKVEDVLEQLGTPADLARKYRGEGKYVIGPQYYDSYVLVLKIVLACTVFGVMIGGFINMITVVNKENSEAFDYIVRSSNIIYDILFSGICAFGFVTLIFAANEKFKNFLAIGKEKNESSWNVSKLPLIPSNKAIINRSDTIIEIIFAFIFFVVFVFTPQILGVCSGNNGKIEFVPIFNLSIWKSIMPFFIISFALSILGDVIKIMVGKINKLVVIMSTVLSVISLGIIVFIFKSYDVWNANFVVDASKKFDLPKLEILNIWGSNTQTNIILAIVAFATLLEIGTVLYKYFRYGSKE